MATWWRGARGALRAVAAVAVSTVVATTGVAGAAPGATAQDGERRPVPVPEVSGPLPGTAPGDPGAPELEDTYPFFSTWVDLAAAGYVEEEFTVSGAADAYGADGTLLAEDVPYETRMVVRRPRHQHRFNGTVLMEWQNVSAGHDIDALWHYQHIMRSGYAWVGVSAQRVGVDQLREWSPTRYGDLDVTGDGQFPRDELSYDIFAQAARAVRPPSGAGAEGGRRPAGPLGRLRAETVLAVGASQSAGRMAIYYDSVLPQVEPVFDGYGFMVGPAPSREGDEPVFHVLSETDVRSADRRPDSDLYRRWEVAGGAHSGWRGEEYRQQLNERDLGGIPTYDCGEPPFSRVPVHHVTGAAYDHLARWARRGTPPPTAEPLELNPDGTNVRNELGLAQGGIQLSQASVPTALNTGHNSGALFCRLFGSHVPFDDARLAELYPSRGDYVRRVIEADLANVRAGVLTPADAWQNLVDAFHADLGTPGGDDPGDGAPGGDPGDGGDPGAADPETGG